MDFPGKNTGVGFYFLLQGIFLTQGLNQGLLCYRQIFFTIWAIREAHKGWRPDLRCILSWDSLTIDCSMSQAIAHMIWDTLEQKFSPNKRKAKTIKCSCTPLVWVLLMACNLEAQTFWESHCFLFFFWSLLFCLFALFCFCLCFVCAAFGIKPVPPAAEAWSLNHWTPRELLEAIVLIRHGKCWDPQAIKFGWYKPYDPKTISDETNNWD